MKSTLLYSVLLFISTSFLFAQQGEPFVCGTVEGPSAPVYFSPLNNQNYSGSVAPEYLASFEPVTFNIFFWGINRTNGTNDYPLKEKDVKDAMIAINEAFNPFGICFVLIGYDTFDNDNMFEGVQDAYQMESLAQQNGHYKPGAFNCYLPYVFNNQGASGYGTFNKTTLAINSRIFSLWREYMVVVHELGHNFDLRHTFVGCENVTRNPNDPNYNALTAGDYVHDTSAVPNFLSEVPGSPHHNINPDTCTYNGNGTDCQGTPYNVLQSDVRNFMAYTPKPCQSVFTTGQMIRARECIQADIYGEFNQRLVSNMTFDLYIKDSPEDFGEEPNTVSDALWKSPDIWVRNLDDNIEKHENPEYNPAAPNYVYVRVRNRGCSASSGEDMLRLYWSKASTSLNWDSHWNGSPFPQGSLRGDEIGALDIPVLEPGEETIIKLPWFPPNPAIYENINEEPWHFCLLARIQSDDDPMSFPETTNLGLNVRKNNNIAQKNVSVIPVNPGSGDRPGSVIAVGNPYDQTRQFSLNFVADNLEEGGKIFEEAEVTIVLDRVLLNAWNTGGGRLNNISRRDEYTFGVMGDNASLGNLVFAGNEVGTLSLQFNFLTQEVTEKELYTYHVVQKELPANEVLGGETYEIHREPRSLFYAATEGSIQANKNETVVLSVEPINEPAVYNWYDSEGNLVYEGADFITSVEIGKKYKLEIIALADGYKDYSEVEVSLKPNSIETIYPNPTSNEVTIIYKINEGDSTYLSVTGFYGSNISNNYILDITENEVTLDISSYPQGLYSIVLITNGQISDITTLIKQ